MTGIVRTLNAEKKFGFIKTEGGDDYFFHASQFHGHWEDLETDFKLGMRILVSFDENKGSKGLRANNVTRDDWPNKAAREYHP